MPISPVPSSSCPTQRDYYEPSGPSKPSAPQRALLSATVQPRARGQGGRRATRGISRPPPRSAISVKAAARDIRCSNREVS